MSSGNQAHRNGNLWERRTETPIREHGYKESDNGKDLFRHREIIDGKYYARQVPVGAAAIRGSSKRITDLLLVNRTAFTKGCCLECKWQQSGGSADRKLDSTVNDARETFKINGTPTIIIYGGTKFSVDRITWLKKQVDGNGLLAAWSLDEFQAAVNDGFLETGIIKSIRSPKSVKPRNPFYENGGLWDEKGAS